MHLLNIPDMSCGHCAKAIEKAVKSVDPDAKIAVDLGSKTASIGSAVSVDTFVTALEDAGYSASSKNDCCSQAV